MMRAVAEGKRSSRLVAGHRVWRSKVESRLSRDFLCPGVMFLIRRTVRDQARKGTADH